MPYLKKTLILALLATSLTGCQTYDIKEMFSSSKEIGETTAPYFQKAEGKFEIIKENKPVIIVDKKLKEPVVEEEIKPISYDHYGLNVIDADNYFLPMPLYGTNKLQNFNMPRMRIIDNNLFNVMERLLQPTDYDLVMSSRLSKRKATRAFTLKGNLPDVVAQLSRVFDVHVIEDNGTVYVKDHADFYVRLPDISKGMLDKIISDLGGIGVEDVKSEQSSTVRYVADYKTNEKVRKYFHDLRVNKPLISYNAYFWEVELDKNKSIHWGQYDRLVMKLDSSLPVGIDDDGSSAVEGVYNLQCSQNGMDPAFIQSFLKTQGKVRFTKRPELTAISGEPVEFSFSEGSNKGFGEVKKTNVKLTGNYDADKVSTKIEITSGVIRGVRQEDKDITKTVIKESARSYPGGVSLVTDINGHSKLFGGNIQYVMMIEPKVDLFEHPGEKGLQRIAEKMHHSCEVEKRNRVKTITFRALMAKELKLRKSEKIAKNKMIQMEHDKELFKKLDKNEVKAMKNNIAK